MSAVLYRGTTRTGARRTAQEGSAAAGAPAGAAGAGRPHGGIQTRNQDFLEFMHDWFNPSQVLFAQVDLFNDLRCSLCSDLNLQLQFLNGFAFNYK